MALSGLNNVSLEPSVKPTVSSSVEKRDVVVPSQESKASKEQSKEKSQSKPLSKAKRRTKPEAASSSVGFIRDVPTPVIKAIRAEFADATNNQDALMAYLACHGTGTVAERANANLTEKQKQLVDSWDGDSYLAIVKQMERMVSRMDKTVHLVEVIQLLSAYMVYDRLGFRNDMPQMPQDANLREDGVMDLLLAAEEQSDGFQHEKDTILGRPIRK